VITEVRIGLCSPLSHPAAAPSLHSHHVLFALEVGDRSLHILGVTAPPRRCTIVAKLGVADALPDEPDAWPDTEPATTKTLATGIGADPDTLHQLPRLVQGHGSNTRSSISSSPR
jgi:hypothetical protein